MKQLFKTSLLAAMVAATCGTAVAGTVAVTKQVHSSEGLKGVTANQKSGNITYTVAAAYAAGDKITFSFPAGSLSATGFPSQLNVAAINGDTTKAIAGMALGLLNADTSSVTYRVTSLSQPLKDPVPPETTGEAYTDRTTIGATIGLGVGNEVTVDYKAAAVLAAPITVSVSSETSVGDVLDSTGTRTGTVAEAKSQFGTAKVTSAFDGVIAVESARKLFTDGATDSYSWTIANPTTTGWLNMATVNATNGTVATLYGEAGKMTDLTAAEWKSGGTNTFTVAAASLAVAYPGQRTNDTVTFTSTGKFALEEQKFTTDIIYNYSSAGAVAGVATVGNAVPSGAWKLNGAVVNIPYMPYGPSASQIMYVSNAGSQEADVLVTAFDDKGTMFDLGVVTRAKGKTVTKLADVIFNGLKAKGFVGTKLSITVTVNAPEADITVYSSYNIGNSDRGFVNTDQYKG